MVFTVSSPQALQFQYIILIPYILDDYTINNSFSHDILNCDCYSESTKPNLNWAQLDFLILSNNYNKHV
jgi:hypothetical protein